MSDFHPNPDALRPDSRIVHPPLAEAVGSRPLGIPLHQGHLFAFDSSDALARAFAEPGEAFFYNRFGNPTVRSLETAVADLEGGTGAIATASGMGAINTVLLALLRSGDHVIAQRSLYGGTFAMLADLAERWGVEVTHVTGDDPGEVEAALRPNTRLLHLETVSNPTTRVTDLTGLIGAAKRAGVVSVVDNTFATPLLCRPIEHGADVVIHSATKYLGGHSDVLAGIAVFADAELRRKVWQFATELGASADPFAAWLTLRGLQTLALRVRRHCDTALDLATRLAAHPAVSAVHYPGLPTHPDHDRARRLLPDGQGGVLVFDLSGGREAARTFTESVRLASLAPSLGGVQTLVLHPARQHLPPAALGRRVGGGGHRPGDGAGLGGHRAPGGPVGGRGGGAREAVRAASTTAGAGSGVSGCPPRLGRVSACDQSAGFALVTGSNPVDRLA